LSILDDNKFNEEEKSQKDYIYGVDELDYEFKTIPDDGRYTYFHVLYS
jgi:hypothetical protein